MTKSTPISAFLSYSKRPSLLFTDYE